MCVCYLPYPASHSCLWLHWERAWLPCITKATLSTFFHGGRQMSGRLLCCNYFLYVILLVDISVTKKTGFKVTCSFNKCDTGFILYKDPSQKAVLSHWSPVVKGLFLSSTAAFWSLFLGNESPVSTKEYRDLPVYQSYLAVNVCNWVLIALWNTVLYCYTPSQNRKICSWRRDRNWGGTESKHPVIPVGCLQCAI